MQRPINVVIAEVGKEKVGPRDQVILSKVVKVAAKYYILTGLFIRKIFVNKATILDEEHTRPAHIIARIACNGINYPGIELVIGYRAAEYHNALIGTVTEQLSELVSNPFLITVVNAVLYSIYSSKQQQHENQNRFDVFSHALLKLKIYELLVVINT
jgi:hypothetical protein